MKYLLTILLFLFIAFPALAAKTVEGTVPELKPLQPPPEGVFLDYENTLNSPVRDDSEEPGDALKLSNENGGNNQSSDAENAQDNTEIGKSLFNQGNFKNIFFVIFTLAVLLAGGYYLRKGSK